MQDKSRIEKFIPIMDEISPTFCMAKWHHTTIYLATGETHSCYHPAPHKIPLEGLEQNPSQLHNTPQKLQERKQMLDGEKPSGCQYCWNVECMGKDYISDRKERNASIYTEERFNTIKTNPLGDVNPQYVEVSFGNECNFKCGYCHPKHSSAYYKEIEQNGPYTMVRNHRNDIDWFDIHKDEETNPYVKAWWAWWPELRKTLTILRITGGEPLLQQSTWRMFEELEKNPCPNLELNINTNLGVKSVLVERFADKVNELVNKGCIKDFKVFTSIDTWGTQAEYIRTGLDLELWEKNLDIYMSRTNMPLTFMITFNILTVTNFNSLLEKILEWRIKYNGDKQTKWQRIRFDTPYLKEPLQYDMNILPKDKFMPYMESHLMFIKNNMDDFDKHKFSEIEYEKFRRVVDYMRNTNYSVEKIMEGRRDFYNWFAEYDRRRNVNFIKTFPELEEFYFDCSTI